MMRLPLLLLFSASDTVSILTHHSSGRFLWVSFSTCFRPKHCLRTFKSSSCSP